MEKFSADYTGGFISKYPVHYVRAWSGHSEDETPVCGAERMAPEVWAYRTQYTRHVSCGDCGRRLGLLGRYSEAGER